MTQEQFIDVYADMNRVDVRGKTEDGVLRFGRVFKATQCDCGWEDCTGWMMADETNPAA